MSKQKKFPMRKRTNDSKSNFTKVQDRIARGLNNAQDNIARPTQWMDWQWKILCTTPDGV